MEIKNGLSSYIKENCKSVITRGPLFEGIRNTDIERALSNIESFLKKRKVYVISAIDPMSVDGDNVFAIEAFNDNNMGCLIIWDRDDTTNIRSIAFTKDFDKAQVDWYTGTPHKCDIVIEMKGASIVRVLQLIADVMSGKIAMSTSALNKAIRDAQIWESVQEEIEAEGFEMVTEANVDPIVKKLQNKRMNLRSKIKKWEQEGKDISGLQAEYDKLEAELNDVRVSVRSNVMVTMAKDPTLDRMEDRFEEEERALPEERFSDMEAYVQNVILGLDVSALICGAPGVGKTYRIMQAIKKAGKVRGIDYEVIKGKATPMALYTLMHDYQSRGQLLVIDDADAIIKDEVMINLVKAATDSSDERIVAYSSSTMPTVPEEKLNEYCDFEQDAKGIWRYPKNFVYEGGMIIITNMNAGQIDTAIRSRALICDLNFTTAEVLDLVRGLSPHIAPELLTPESKDKALEYLEELAESGAPMEISIRSFTLVAKMYMSNAPESAIQRRIKEQMRLKFLRGGKRY